MIALCAGLCDSTATLMRAPIRGINKILKPGSKVKNIVHLFFFSTLLCLWKEWRNAIGPNIKAAWIKKIKIENMGAREHGMLNIKV